MAAPLEGSTDLQSRASGLDYRGPLSGFVAVEVPRAVARDASVLDAVERWGSSAYPLETVPTVLHVLSRHAADPEAAILHAVNETWDNDTIAAIVGAAVGALHGRRALPSRWIEGLLGRTREDHDGRVFALIEQARIRWGQRS